VSHPPSIKSSRGFTLAEVMVAVLVMIVGMLGLLEMIDVSLQQNLKNQLRDEAVHVGERYMSELRGMPFETIVSSYPVATATSKIRGAIKNYSVERSSLVLATDSASSPTSLQLTVVVKWGFRNVTSQNTVISVVTP
jgi:type IV pilus assembly protein PilV